MAGEKDPKMHQPRDMESEYFAQKELDLRKKLREKLDKQRQDMRDENLKQAHWMKCPKCGHELSEKSYQDVAIDQCESCKGVWLDQGELELLLHGRKSRGFLSRFMEVHLEDIHFH